MLVEIILFKNLLTIFAVIIGYREHLMLHSGKHHSIQRAQVGIWCYLCELPLPHSFKCYEEPQLCDKLVTKVLMKHRSVSTE